MNILRMRSCLRCIVKINIKSITCPGTIHIRDRNHVFVSICLFGQLRRSKSVLATFPLCFNDKFIFERVFTNALTLDGVQEILEDESVIIELCQYSSNGQGGKVLASCEQCSKDFLFPKPSFVLKDGFKRETLLTRVPEFAIFTGLDPKLAFSTQTEIVEADLVERCERRPLQGSSVPRSETKAHIRKKSAKSFNGDEARDMTVSDRMEKSASGCSCRSCQRPTRSSSGKPNLKSRTASPKKNLSCLENRPPFKVGPAPPQKVSPNIIDNKAHGPLPIVKYIYENDDNNEPSNHVPKARVRAPKDVFLFPSSDEDVGNDSKAGEPNVSTVRMSRPRGDTVPRRSYVSPIKRDRMSPGDVRRRVQQLLNNNASLLKYDLSDSSSEDEDPPEKSISLPLGIEKDWALKSSSLTGQSYRESVNESFKDIYQNMYEQALKADKY